MELSSLKRRLSSTAESSYDLAKSLTSNIVKKFGESGRQFLANFTTATGRRLGPAGVSRAQENF